MSYGTSLGGKGNVSLLCGPLCGPRTHRRPFSRTSSREVLAGEFGIAQFVNVDLGPRYNIAPSQTVEAIILDGPKKRLGDRQRSSSR